MNNYIKKITIVLSVVLIITGIFACISIIVANPVINSSHNKTTVSFSHINSSSFTTNAQSTYLVDGYSLGGNNESVSDITAVSIISNIPLSINNTSFNCISSQPDKRSQPRMPNAPSTGTIPLTASSSLYSSTMDGIFSHILLLNTSSLVRISAHNLLLMGDFWFFIAFIGNILMMLLGGYLRLHSGRSPGYAYAF